MRVRGGEYCTDLFRDDRGAVEIDCDGNWKYDTFDVRHERHGAEGLREGGPVAL